MIEDYSRAIDFWNEGRRGEAKSILKKYPESYSEIVKIFELIDATRPTLKVKPSPLKLARIYIEAGLYNLALNNLGKYIQEESQKGRLEFPKDRDKGRLGKLVDILEQIFE